MADQKAKKPDRAAEANPAGNAATPRFDPKPVQLGGESLGDRLLPHLRKLVILLVAVAIVLAVVFFFVWLRDRREAKDTEKLAAVLDIADKPMRPPSDPTDPKAKPGEGFATTQERAVAILDALAKQGTDAAGSTYRASLLAEAGKLDDAIAEYRKGATQVGLDGVLAREGLGIALETKATAEKDPTARQQGLEDALATFKTMQPDAAGPRYAFALYHQARMLALLGKRDDAKAAFAKAKELSKDTELAELVDERLATL